MINITKKQAREFLVKYHGFHGGKFKGKEGIRLLVKQIGCIQYDPLNVVGRNPDLVLQARINNYKPKYLYDLLYKDRLLLDGWDKQMSIYSVGDFPYFYNKFYLETRLESFKGTLRRRKVIGALDYIDEVKTFIDKSGPIKPKEIDLGSVGKKGSWGHGRLSSVVMDYLYNNGELVVDHKVGVQKVYQLTEKVLDEALINQQPFINENALYKWHILRRIGSVGILWNKSGGAYLEYYLKNSKIRKEIIEELVSEGKLLEVGIEGFTETFYIRPSEQELLLDESKVKSIMSFLAPLDNLIWDRKLTAKLFDFEYSWEVYVPKDKRKYGYYILPVLYKDKIIARFEPLIDKERNSLVINNWWYQEGVKETKAIQNAKEKALVKFAKYLNVNYSGVKQ